MRDRRRTRAARTYLDRVESGLAPYADKPLADRIKKGVFGPRLRARFLTLAEQRRADHHDARLQRVEAYLAAIEAGAPISSDPGAAQAIAKGWMPAAMKRRFDAERDRRRDEDKTLVEQFLIHYAATGTVNVDGRKHAGYNRLRRPEFAAERRRFAALQEELRLEDERLIEAMVTAFEANWTVTDVQRYNRVLKFPNAYPSFHARLRRAQLQRQESFAAGWRSKNRKYINNKALKGLWRIPTDKL